MANASEFLDKTSQARDQNNRRPLFSPLRLMAAIQVLFFLPAVFSLYLVGKVLELDARDLLQGALSDKLTFLAVLAPVAACFLFTGLSALEMWRQDRSAVQFFRRVFVLYLLVDVFLITVVLVIFMKYDLLRFAVVLLPILVFLPFYQRHLALKVLAEENI
jgi:hypothetical protein